MSNTEYTTEFITGTIEYARVHTPRNKYGTDGRTPLEQEFSLNLLLDTKEAQDSYNVLKNKYNIPDQVLGHDKVKTKDDGTPFIVLKTNAGFTNKAGEIVSKTIEVVDCTGSSIPGNVLIGNGTTAKVAITAFINKTGQGSLKLSGVQVLELVRFEPKSKLFSSTGGTPVVESHEDSSSDSDSEVF